MHPDLLPAIIERRALAVELAALVAGAAPERWAASGENPDWTCRDLLAHLANGDWVMQRLVRDVLAARDLSWFSQDVTDLDAGNAERIAAGRTRGIADLLADLRAQSTQSLALWELLSERHLDTIMPRWRGGYQRVRDYLLWFPTHERGHIAELRASLTTDAGV